MNTFGGKNRNEKEKLRKRIKTVRFYLTLQSLVVKLVSSLTPFVSSLLFSYPLLHLSLSHFISHDVFPCPHPSPCHFLWSPQSITPPHRHSSLPSLADIVSPALQQITSVFSDTDEGWLSANWAINNASSAFIASAAKIRVCAKHHMVPMRIKQEAWGCKYHELKFTYCQISQETKVFFMYKRHQTLSC